MNKSGVEILEELKEEDFYRHINFGNSRFSEEDWDWIIEKFKEKRMTEVKVKATE